MFREMRRKKQQLPQEEAEALLRGGSHGVLAVSGDDGYPYAVPLSYVFDGKTLYFHCAKSGHKLDAVRACGKASFCVVGQDDVVPEAFTTHYRSVIVFGRVRIVGDDAERAAAIRLLARRYAPEATEAELEAAVAREEAALCMLALEIEHLTGKEAVELTRARQG